MEGLCVSAQTEEEAFERFAKTIRQQRKKPGRIAKVPCYAKDTNPLCRSRKRRRGAAAAAAAGVEVSKLSFATLQITQKQTKLSC